MEIWDWTKSTLVAVGVVLLLHRFGFYLSAVSGSSMQPTLQDGEWLLVNKAVTYMHEPRRGDVVIVSEPQEERAKTHPFLVKRVVAVAGDRVEVRGGLLWINGEALTEAYADSPIEGSDMSAVTVAPGRLFVMGDNRHFGASSDSRAFGAVAVESVQGRAEWIVWPPNQAGPL
uniref:Signal peptidase I n=2 Tax=Paenibacillus athensensis TaxID=1967502 RepID=A0A4Y8Q3F8_9BACL